MPQFITVAGALAPPIRSLLNRPDGELLAGIHPDFEIERVLFLAGLGAVYDAFIDKEGNLYGMDPQPPELHDMMQVVIENVGGRLADGQKGCLTFLIKINSVSEIFLYKGREFDALPVPQL
ncbi:hypothetical protein HFO24_02985 [Rhizobium laguerreae]|uniref:hypothetical protein n=1 Tax=Rhizobium laguerreae TaxID=1076926 RepID=UPI001C906284|nr:hypothetical protein [Rhizobium laguerreae]MBY3180644.1 hypothetical protein [Rhizobium laguerreae]